MEGVVCIESKFYLVENGEYKQVNMETSASQVKLEDGSDAAQALAGYGTRLDALEAVEMPADVSGKVTANETAITALQSGQSEIAARLGEVEKLQATVTALETRLAALEAATPEPNPGGESGENPPSGTDETGNEDQTNQRSE